MQAASQVTTQSLTQIHHHPCKMQNSMTDMTPLPSPTVPADHIRQFWDWPTFESCPPHLAISSKTQSVLVTQNGESISSVMRNQQKRISYRGPQERVDKSIFHDSFQLEQEVLAGTMMRNRSEKEALSQPEDNDKNGILADIRTHAPLSTANQIELIHPPADLNLARKPDLTSHLRLETTPRPPTPPPSRKGTGSSESELCIASIRSLSEFQEPYYEYFMAYRRKDMKLRRWKGIKLLGEGAFSKVFLATSEISDEDLIDPSIEWESSLGAAHPSHQPSTVEKKEKGDLVAVKICEYGPKGGASGERVEISIKREVENMKDVYHPSIVNLKAWNMEESRAVLVLGYCPGGDLFDFAKDHHDLLVPNLLQRIFSELVGAVRYLHGRGIVHRDIKLENVLVNISLPDFRNHRDWSRYPYSVITLTDLGFSYRFTENEKLTTRCGSEYYAAPEIITSQAYDGRTTDAWSLGIILYALLETRLPFGPACDGTGNRKQNSRPIHRIARVEWQWDKFSGPWGDHEADPEKFRQHGLEGAMEITEGLIQRAKARWSLDQVAETEWVKNAIQLEHGIMFRDKQISENVSGDC